jgi:hypothetical protein
MTISTFDLSGIAFSGQGLPRVLKLSSLSRSKMVIHCETDSCPGKGLDSRSSSLLSVGESFLVTNHERKNVVIRENEKHKAASTYSYEHLNAE